MSKEGDQQSPDTALDIIRNPGAFTIHFFGEYREIWGRLMDTTIGEDNIYMQSDQQTRTDVLKELRDFFGGGEFGGQAGVTFHWEVYCPFAVDRGFTRKIEYAPEKWGDAAIPVSELSEAQKAEWEKYLNSVKFTINRRSIIAEAISLIPFPTVTTKYRDQNIPLALALEGAKRNIVNRLIPNISTEEAQKALGPKYTANIMKSSVSPE